MARNIREGVLGPLSAKLETTKDVERFVSKMWKSGRVQSAFPKATKRLCPKVKDGRGTRIAHACSDLWYRDESGNNFKHHGHINIPIWARSEGVVVHELAHIVTNHEHGKTGVAAHGWQFANVFLKLTLYMIGREAHDILKASFKQHRVRFSKPRERKSLSPERREQMIAVLAYARARRQALKVA